MTRSGMSLPSFVKGIGLTSAAWLVVCSGLAVGQERSALVLPPPPVMASTAQPDLPPPSQPAGESRQGIAEEGLVPTPQAEPAAVIRPTCITYRADRHARRMVACNGSVDVTMVVQNPADGCLYEIPLCIPACCTGQPTVQSYCGLFGRGVVQFCWPCGYAAKVKFRHILGDIKVKYDGR